MRDFVRGVALGLAALAAFAVLASAGGWLTLALPRASGAGPWLVSRATGFAAFAALSLDAIVGLSISTRLGDRWVARAHVIDLHGWLSPVALALVLGHAGVLLTDGHVRFGLGDVLVPFAASYRPFAVGLGGIAAYLAVVVHVSFALRRRIGARTWRRLHYATFAVFVAASAHGVLAGSDAGRPWAWVLYGLPIAFVGALAFVRVVRACRTSSPPRGASR